MEEEYRQRREQLMEKIGTGTAIFRSAPVALMNNDVEYPYRQDSDFFYLTGFKEPEAVLVLAPHHENHRFILFVRPKDSDQEVWTGGRAGVEGAKERYGADEAHLITELNEKLPPYLEKADRIYYHFGLDRTFNESILTFWQQLMIAYPKRGVGPIAIQDSGTILHPLRMIKTQGEIELMQKASAISVEAHQHAWKTACPSLYEYEIQAEIEYIFRKHGADGPAYPSIVASGPNSCTLHYNDNKRQLQNNDLLLIDAACSYGYYNADITRTLPVSGKFTAEQKKVYEIVLEAQEQAIAQIKPGNTYKMVQETAIRVITEGLVELGLLTGDTDELIKNEKYKPFYMHRIGHWIGLDAHDVGVYQYGETSHILQPGNVLTVEPGIYIAPDVKPSDGQPEIGDRWRGIGVRIEDDVLVTLDGHEVLTASLPRSVEEVEQFLS
ncbi:MAG: aminopeptidase P N-terminal domain-containing protein [Pseudomonadota bacterium]